MSIQPYYKTDNAVLYQSDNLELMKQLPTKYIDLIYCDILYNTGRKFGDYDDNLGTAEEAVDWYKNRLFEMHRILKDDGSIYLHMDHRLSHYIKVKMDELFGYDNFKNEITWKRQPPRGARAKSRQYARISDVILFYTKSNNHTWNAPYKKYGEKMMKRYKKDENGRLYRLGDLGDYSEKSIEKFEKLGKIYVTKNNKKQLIRFLDEENGEPVSDIWDDINNVNSMATERLNYDTQKPKRLLERIITTSSNENDIVADFFMGSGTTGEVSIDLKRRFIGCDIGERACKVSKSRIEKFNQ